MLYARHSFAGRSVLSGRQREAAEVRTRQHIALQAHPHAVSRGLSVAYAFGTYPVPADVADAVMLAMQHTNSARGAEILTRVRDTGREMNRTLTDGRIVIPRDDWMHLKDVTMHYRAQADE